MTNTSNKGGEILTALKERLETIKESLGYSVTIKSVRLNEVQPTINTAEGELPLVEVIDDGETYEMGAGAGYVAFPTVVLYIVAPKAYTDVQMQLIMADIRRALYGGAPDATGNTGMTLGGRASKIELLDAAGDLNMVQSNRTYVMRIRLHSHRTTYRD